MALIENQQFRFSIPPDVTYMNCAYMAPLLKNVHEAGSHSLNQLDMPWTISDQWFQPTEELRFLFAKIINSGKDHIAFIPSASYGIAVAKNNIQLKPSQEIVVLDQQYPSNIYAWRELSKESGAAIITVNKEPGQTWTECLLEHINEHTGLVAIPNCHWTDGSLIDLEQVSEKVKKFGARLVIDASQSAGAYPIDISKIKPDFLVTVGHKWLLGSFGFGYLYADEKYFTTGKPLEFSWYSKKGSENFSRLVDYTDDYRAGARRFDVGSAPGILSVPMARAALTQLLEWGVENIQETLLKLTSEIALKAAEHGFEVPENDRRAGHIVGIRLEESKAAEISKKLIANKIHVSFRGANIRVSPHLYNDSEDIDKLFRFL